MVTRRSLRWLFALLVVTYLGAGRAQAQVSASTRIAGDWRSSRPIALPDSAAPLAVAGRDEGAAPGNQLLGRMVLLLQPSPAQQQALAAELSALQDPTSPQFHRWLSASAFAEAYSNSPADVAAVAAWLQSQGFQVGALPAGRGWIEFSGTVAQAEQAFQAQIHLVAGASGVARPVLIGNISAPAVLRPVIAGLVSLDGVVSLPALTVPQSLSASVADLAAETSPANAEALTPKLDTQLLDLTPLFVNGVTGAGQTIAIAASSNIHTGDVAAFRTAFGLPASPLTVDVDGNDPGLTEAQAETTLAASWAGAVAPGAQVVVVPAATTNATDGVDLSLAAIVDQHLAGTVAVGYSACEAGMSAAHREFYGALYQQASAEGMTIAAAAGDSGAAACSVPGGTAVASGYGVNAMASTPWDTAVGVAGFAASSAGFAGWSPDNTSDPAYAGGGGSSTIYGAQSWQPAPAEFPAGYRRISARQVPDLSLPTAIDAGANPGLAFCLSGADSADSCTWMRSGGSGAAASLFAGIAALRAQQQGAQGDLAPMLYKLTQSAAAPLFQDVTSGSAQLACAAGSPGCGSNGQIGFTAADGYDLATGLGVPDAANLVKAQFQGTGTTPATVLNTTVSGQTVNPSGSVTLSASVTSSTGTGVPTGTITFYDQTTGNNLVTATLSTVSSDSSAVSQTATGALAAGSHAIVAEYSGDTTFAGSNSSPVSVNVQSSTTATTVTPAVNTVTGGSALGITVTVTSANAGTGAVAPSGTVTFSVDGASAGSSTLIAKPAAGTSTSSSATATITAPYAAGSHQILAAYNGDSNYLASTSPSVSFTVNVSTPTVTLTPSTTTPSAGANVILNATVAPPGSGSGASAPSGSVAFVVDGATVNTAAVTHAVPATASYTLTGVMKGSHTVQANYSGDSNYAAANSGAVSLVVGKGATVTTVAATPAVLSSGTAESFTATIAPETAASGTTYTFTGTVTFYDGATALGQAPVANNTATLTGITLAPNISHSITAVYSGDTNWLGSTSTALPMAAATLPVTVMLTANTANPTPGQAVVLSATVTPSSTPLATAEQNPSGIVVFYNGTTVIGQASLVAQDGTYSSIATLISSTLPGGALTISAYYKGDLAYDAMVSNSIVLTVQNFSITPAPTNPATNLNIVQGSAGSVSFNVTALGGFAGTVQLECQAPPQDSLTCSATPQQVTPPGVVSFTIQTYTTTPPQTASRKTPWWPGAVGGSALAGLAFFLLPFGKRMRVLVDKESRRIFILVLMLAGIVGSCVSCTSTGGIAGVGTPLGVATIKVIGNAYVDNTVVSQSVYFTVNVLKP